MRFQVSSLLLTFACFAKVGDNTHCSDINDSLENAEDIRHEDVEEEKKKKLQSSSKPRR